MIVIGIGNEFRHDDGVGVIAVRRLREEGITAEEADPDPATLMDRWIGADEVVLVDAVSSGVVPGTIHYLDASKSATSWDLFKTSTHAMGLGEAVELSRLLGTLPAHVHVFGIEGEDFSPGVGLSRQVERALPMLIDRIKTAAKLLS